MYQALYRKYRPATFADVVGQEHITDTLRRELAAGKIFHAYLFTGTRGTGKTSCAKILAKAVNCLHPADGDACGECESCRAIAAGEVMDIVEIDAASNNSVENIRDLREQVNFTPAVAKYRVYIIDEVHMLTLSAFNALLKTLEEPPAHVIFILATTELHKLPATILSRCQRFDFRRISVEQLCARMQFVASQEGFTLTDAAATLIASLADGGMRDALSILDQCASAGREIGEALVSRVCGMAGQEHLVQMADRIAAQDAGGALQLLDSLYAASVDMARLVFELTSHYRNLMICKTVPAGSRPIVCSSSQLETLERQAERYDLREILSILSILQDTAGRMQTGNRRCEVELALLRLCTPRLRGDAQSLEARVAALERGRGALSPAAPASEPVTPPAQREPQPQPQPEPQAAPEVFPAPEAEAEPPADELNAPDDALPPPPDEPDATPPPPETGDAPLAEWPSVLQVLAKTCPLIHGVLQGSRAFVRGDLLLIDAPNPQFRALVKGESPVYRDQIRRAAEQILGRTFKLGPYRKPVAQADPLVSFAERLSQFDFSGNGD